MNFEFYTASKIIFGSGKVDGIGSLAKSLGDKTLLVVGGGSFNFGPILTLISESGVNVFNFSVHKEPDTKLIDKGVKIARKNKVDSVIAIGGGSVMDAGKAISAMLTNPGVLTDYLEVVGSAKKIKFRAAPFMAIPTTSGTGSEVTKNAVIKLPDQNVKVSLRSELIIPTIALVDPDLTRTLPPDVTASTGMDAFTQVIEPYVSNKANPFVDMICEKGIQFGSQALLSAHKNGNDLEAREGMSYMSLMGGLALANAGLGAVHGFAGPIGGMFNLPHGVICARLLPYVFNCNVNAMTEREPDSAALVKYKEISKIIIKRDDASVKDSVDWIFNLCNSLNIPRLSDLGINKKHFQTIVEKAKRASSMKGNPIQLTDQELLSILNQAF